MISTENADLHMLRITVKMPELFRIADRPQLRSQNTDVGYLIHCLLNELFAEKAPHPFSMTKEIGHSIEILAYSEYPAQKLKHIAGAKKANSVFDTVDWKDFISKKMPNVFCEGNRYHFRLRACPVIRKSRGSGKYKSGAEVDVFLNEIVKRQEGIGTDRKEVYINWLGEYLSSNGIETSQNSIRITRLKLSSLTRRKGNRKTISITRPDATFEGKLTVRNPSKFRNKLTHGFGRHSGFGFGMMLLRR